LHKERERRLKSLICEGGFTDIGWLWKESRMEDVFLRMERCTLKKIDNSILHWMDTRKSMIMIEKSGPNHAGMGVLDIIARSTNGRSDISSEKSSVQYLVIRRIFLWLSLIFDLFTNFSLHSAMRFDTWQHTLWQIPSAVGMWRSESFVEQWSGFKLTCNMQTICLSGSIDSNKFAGNAWYNRLRVHSKNPAFSMVSGILTRLSENRQTISRDFLETLFVYTFSID
jgi:hypothetical protein